VCYESRKVYSEGAAEFARLTQPSFPQPSCAAMFMPNRDFDCLTRPGVAFIVAVPYHSVPVPIRR